MGKNVGHKGGPSHASEEKKKKQDLVFYDYLRPFPAGYLFIGRCISKRKNIGRIRHPFVIRLSWCQSTLQHEFHLSFDLIFLSSRIFSSVVSVSFPLLNLVMACNHFDIFSSFASRWWLSFACLFFFFKVDDSSLVLVVFSLFSSIPGMLLSFLWFFFFETVPEINQKTLFLPSESTYMMLMPTGTTFHWP